MARGVGERRRATNACAFPGHVVEVRGARLTGTGSYDECVRGLRRQIATLEREQGVRLRMPREFDRIDRFLGMSLLFHLTNFMRWRPRFAPVDASSDARRDRRRR